MNGDTKILITSTWVLNATTPTQDIILHQANFKSVLKTFAMHERGKIARLDLKTLMLKQQWG